MNAPSNASVPTPNNTAPSDSPSDPPNSQAKRAFVICQGPRCVLVVDDDRPIREMLQTILEDEHFQVEAVANGQEALEALRRGGHGRLVLLDLMMPVMDGRAVYAHLVDNPLLRDAHQLIIFSAQATDPREFPLAAAIVHKPFELAALLGTLEQLADGRELVPTPRPPS